MNTISQSAFLSFSALLASLAAAQSISGTLTQPTLDRWNYPFASQPGAESSAPIFAALGQAGFDDRDAQFLLGFDTSALIPAGYGSNRYQIGSVDVTVWVSVDNKFEYDPSFDSVASSYAAADPAYISDTDTGKPVEIFAVGYRSNWTSQTFGEHSPFSPFAPFPLREGVRNTFPAIFDAAGNGVDVSRQVRQHFEATPMAVGVNDTLTPGQLVPAGTPLTFRIDLNNAAVQAYLASGFNNGIVTFMVTSLHPASGGPGGGTGPAAYPAFFTKENGLAQANHYTASMSFNVAGFPGADFNVDGGIDGSDVEAFFMAWEAGDDTADFNMDGGVNGADVEAFFIAWERG